MPLRNIWSKIRMTTCSTNSPGAATDYKAWPSLWEDCNLWA